MGSDDGYRVAENVVIEMFIFFYFCIYFGYTCINSVIDFYVYTLSINVSLICVSDIYSSISYAVKYDLLFHTSGLVQGETFTIFIAIVISRNNGAIGYT